MLPNGAPLAKDAEVKMNDEHDVGILQSPGNG